MVQINIWDTAGHERFANLAPMYYRGAQGALVVYDITQADSLERAKFWIKELNQKVTESMELCICIIIGKLGGIGI